jgi:hypothetical protein
VLTHLSKNLLEAIPKKSSNGSVKKLKLLKRSLVTVVISTPLPVPEGLQQFWKKSGYEYVKAATQTEAIFTVENTKDPSAEGTLMGGKFYSNVWMKGG